MRRVEIKLGFADKESICLKMIFIKQEICFNYADFVNIINMGIAKSIIAKQKILMYAIIF